MTASTNLDRCLRGQSSCVEDGFPDLVRRMRRARKLHMSLSGPVTSLASNSRRHLRKVRASIDIRRQSCRVAIKAPKDVLRQFQYPECFGRRTGWGRRMSGRLGRFAGNGVIGESMLEEDAFVATDWRQPLSSRPKRPFQCSPGALRVTAHHDTGGTVLVVESPILAV